MVMPQYVIPTETPQIHYPLRSPHEGLVPLCLMLVLAKLQGTTTQGFLAAGGVGQLAGMPAYSAGILLYKAFDCGYVRRATGDGKIIYGLSPAGFRWLQLWVKDIATSCHAVSQIPNISPVPAVELVLTMTYDVLCSGWVDAMQATLGAAGPARPQLAEALVQDPLAIKPLCYSGHWSQNQLRTTGPCRAYSQHWWPVWSQELRLTPSVLNNRPH